MKHSRGKMPVLAVMLFLFLYLMSGCGSDGNTLPGSGNRDSGIVSESAEEDSSAESIGLSNEQEGQEEFGDREEQEETEESGEREKQEETGGSEEKKEEHSMYLYLSDQRLPVSLEDNSSVTELLEILQQRDITFTADDYGGFEKVGSIGERIVTSDRQITTAPGDVILYQGNHICLYYGSNSWSFTKLGSIEGCSTEELKTLMKAGQGEIEVRISLH